MHLHYAKEVARSNFSGTLNTQSSLYVEIEFCVLHDRVT